jgi:hypothetical protein
MFRNLIRIAVREEYLARKHVKKPHLWTSQFSLHPLGLLALVFTC